WSGAGTNSLWLNPLNWIGNVAPNQGDNLSFPAGVARLTNTNDFAAGSMFNSITFSGSDYVIAGNLLSLNTGLTNTPPTATGSTFVAGTLIVQNSITVLEPIALSGTINNQLGVNTFSGNITLNTANATFEVATNTVLNLNGALSGSGGLVKVGPGSLTLAGTN